MDRRLPRPATIPGAPVPVASLGDMARTPRALGAAVSVGVVGVVACGALGTTTDSAFTTCPFRLATGLPCPFCGVTRSLLALGGGDLAGSLAFSPLGPATLVAALAFLAAAAIASWRSRPLRLPLPIVTAAGGAVLVAWMARLTAPL